MNKSLYNLMDWAGIEGIIYSEEDHPEKYLGCHKEKYGFLIQAFFPDAVEAHVSADDKKYQMEMVDEAGYFAVLIPKQPKSRYTYHVIYKDSVESDYLDPYTFGTQISIEDAMKFKSGICYDVYNLMGAHPMTVDGIEGINFAVWAPGAVRVSVVGDFTYWDGRKLPMRRLGDTGIFELFVPNLKAGAVYKFEIKAKGGLTYTKADPYAYATELRPNTASIVTDLSDFAWSDNKWMEQRAKTDTKKSPMFIYEVHLASFKTPDDGRKFFNYRELAKYLADYVLEMGYTHVELLPIMEHPLDESLGYQIGAYYAPTSRFGTPQDFMYFINYLHERNIGVILDWVPSHFPKDTFGLSNFDGTHLYEHADRRKYEYSSWGNMIFNYGRPEVANFLISSALFWKNMYHADGIRLDSVASMLYLNYGKRDGEWVANIYGENENLDAIEFFKHLNTVFKKSEDGAILIAEDSSAWPKVTMPIEEKGLGFDYKWNTGWTNDTLEYMELDPIFRSYHHGELIFSMVYAYSEDFVLTLPHDSVTKGKSALLSKMPGKRKNKYANLRALYGYMMTHPGKKLLFMGQDFGVLDEWNGIDEIDWEILNYGEHKNLQDYLKALVKLYKEYPALYKKDYDPSGFEWINNFSANENILVFLRKGEQADDDLLIICNFSPLVYENHKIGVPYEGRYKEIFNSDNTAFGGAGNVNPRVKSSKKSVCDDREDSISVLIPPMGISIFKCSKLEK